MSTITIGSPKQVAWAEDIKAQVIRAFDKALSFREERGELNRDHPTVQRQERQIRRWLETKTDASWWIDNCHDVNGGLPIWPNIHLWLNKYLDEIKQISGDEETDR